MKDRYFIVQNKFTGCYYIKQRMFLFFSVFVIRAGDHQSFRNATVSMNQLYYEYNEYKAGFKRIKTNESN